MIQQGPLASAQEVSFGLDLIENLEFEIVKYGVF
jgi:hypothetical protein